MKSQVTHNIKGDQSVAQTLTAHSTKFDVVEGKIGALITETELEELTNGDKTLYGKTAATEQTVDGFKQQYVQDKIQYDATRDQVSSMNSKVATFETSINGLTSDLSQVKTNYVSKDDEKKGYAENLNVYPYYEPASKTQNGLTFTTYEDGTVS